MLQLTKRFIETSGLQRFSPINEAKICVETIPLVAKVALDPGHNYLDLLAAPLQDSLEHCQGKRLHTVYEVLALIHPKVIQLWILWPATTWHLDIVPGSLVKDCSIGITHAL